MATLREIRRRIVGVKSTQQITKAMKMVSAAKLRRAQDSILRARPYALKMNSLLRHLITIVDKQLNPLLVDREEKNVLIIVVTSDRGLCGSFNSNILRRATEFIEQNYSEYLENGKLKITCIGKKGFDFLSKRGYPINSKYLNLFNNLQFPIVIDIVSGIKSAYLNQQIDKVLVIYNEFKSIIQQEIKIEQFLPIPPEEIIEDKTSKFVNLVDYIYEPNSQSIINKLIEKHLNTQMWRILLESNAAEQGARMTAMDNATENAKEMIKILSLSYNRARQSSITKELLEIVAGADALKESA